MSAVTPVQRRYEKLEPLPTGVRKFLPSIAWGQAYKKALLQGDVSAGLTTAVMLIPQAMAYAMLAGLPPIVGLYASFLPLAVYALLGTSRQLAVGPVAMVSLLSLQGVSAVAEPGTPEFVSAALLLALLVGVLQIAMGVFRLGFLVNFLSHPVISGFTSAAAIIIGMSQLKHLLGVRIEKDESVLAVLQEAAAKVAEWHWLTIGIGVAAIAILFALQAWKKTFPRALAVVVLGSVAVFALGWSELGVKIVGEVPAGLPAFTSPSFAGFSKLLPVGIAIALVGFMESISVAKAFARRGKYEVDASQELLALGAANVAAAFTGGYPVTGGFSRTAVNAQAGAKTPLSSLITAGMVGLTLLFLTPLFHYLPKSVLAAIILTAVIGLIDVHEMKHLYHVKKADFVLLMLTFFATLGLGIEEGILVGVAASLLTFIVRTTRPHVAVLGRIDGTDEYRNVKNYPAAKEQEGILAVRVDAQFYFGNVTFLKETLRELELARGERLMGVVLDASSMNQLDSSAESALSEILSAFTERDIDLIIANIKGPVREVMQRSGLWERLGKSGRAFTVHEAVERLRGRTVAAGPTPSPITIEETESIASQLMPSKA